MTSMMKFTSPMGAAAIEAAAESLAKQSLALTDLHRSMAAYEAATGSQIAVVDADAQLVSYGVDLASAPDKTPMFPGRRRWWPNYMPIGRKPAAMPLPGR